MANNSTNRTTLVLALAASALLLAGRAEAGPCDCSVLPSLGAAFDYPVMSFGKNITSSGSVWSRSGNMGLGNVDSKNGKVTASGSEAVIQGIYHHPSTSVVVSDATVGAIIQQDMSQAVSDALAFSAALAAFTRSHSTAFLTRYG